MTRARSAVLAVVVIIAVIGLAHFHPATGFSLPFIPTFEESAVFVTPTINDVDNRHLSSEQCLQRFPALYHEADQSKKWASGGISENMVDEAEKDGASARLAIVNNKLYVKAIYWGVNTRTQASIAAIHNTLLTSVEPLPDVDFVIQTSDGGGGKYPHFVLDRKKEDRHLWLMPDFGFYSWPEPGVGAYTEVRDKTQKVEEDLGLSFNGSKLVSSSWEQKIPRLLWRGVPMVEVRQDLLRGSENQPWSDVQALDWGKVNDEGEKANGGDLKSPAEHCEYQYLAHVEGWAYSGRLKYLQQCRSVIVMHPLEWIQHFHHLFISDPNDPRQNVVEVPLPLEANLPGVMEKLLDPSNAERTERIAQNSWNDLREGYLSPAANECYFRYVLNAYASVQTFQPKVDRGVPYESFMLMGSTHWDPHR